MAVTLRFLHSEIFYDVNNGAWIEGGLLPPDAGPHATHMAQDIGQDGNRDRALRVLSLAHAAAVEMLYPYTKTEARTDTLDDTLTEPDAWEITLTVPEEMSQTTLILLEKLIHEWLVCRVLHDWLSITTTTDNADTWLQKAGELESAISACMNTRRGRNRIKQHPF